MDRPADSGAPWRSLRNVDPRPMRQSRLQAHAAIQWLARAARAYVPALPDDAHTSLEWVDGIDSFMTRPLRDGSRLGLNIPTLTLSLHAGGAALSFALHGQSDKEALRWLGGHLAAQGLDAAALDRPSPYAMPDGVPAEGDRYDAVGTSDGLAELAAWFANASMSLEPIRARAAARKLDVSAARCWPHHFDLATLISFPARGGDTGYVGAGLSPGDGYYDEPYFYVSVYPKPDPQALPELPQPGDWHTLDFTAAIVTAASVATRNDAQSATEQVLEAAVDRAVALLA
jgi:hypothetical protein